MAKLYRLLGLAQFYQGDYELANQSLSESLVRFNDLYIDDLLLQTNVGDSQGIGHVERLKELILQP